MYTVDKLTILVS